MTNDGCSTKKKTDGKKALNMQTVGRVSHSHLFLIVTAGKEELESGTAHCCLGGWPEDNRGEE